MAIKESVRKAVNFELGGLPIFSYFLMGSLTILFWRMGKLADTGIVGAFAFMWTIGILLFAFKWIVMLAFAIALINAYN